MIITHIEPEEAKIGDLVCHRDRYPTEERFEVIKKLEHKTHGIKYPHDTHCYLNGLYWEYDMMIVIRVEQ